MSAHLGDRLHRYRRYAGLTQRALAQRSEVSVSLIRLIEQGERDTTRLATAHRLARALHITTGQLIAEHRDTRSAPAADHSRWAPLRAAVLESAVDESDEVPDARAVRDGLISASGHYEQDQYDALSVELPLLVRDARALADLTPEGPGLLVGALHAASRVMVQTHQYAAAAEALDRAEQHAGDQSHYISAVTTRCWLLLRRGRLAECQALAARWADEVEPRVSRATPGELSAWGWMLVRVAAAAARDHRPDEADHAIRAASAAAAMLPRPHHLSVSSTTPYSAAMVAAQRVEHAMLRDDPAAALSLTSTMDHTAARPSANAGRRHLVTKAGAQAQLRKYADATHTLLGVEAEAPVWFGHQQSARDVVELITSRRRTLTPEMRYLVQRVGLG